MFADASKNGVRMSKDPHVIEFGNRYLMYYSMPPSDSVGWTIGIAESHDLVNWVHVGEISPDGGCEKNGLCAPCARVIDGQVHIFYQTYGNGSKDAICHAVSSDGIRFLRDSTNPIFSPPVSEWSNGRAIDAEVCRFGGKYYLYFATRDTSGTYQMPGVAIASGENGFGRSEWVLAKDAPILSPQLPWEKKCIEGMSVIERNGRLYMFYAGGYNNDPQQIGVAVSDNGLDWTRISEMPFLPNGPEGSWNSSESGHPHIFEASDGETYLFYQGNNTGGRDWYISNCHIKWTADGPYIP